MKKISGEKEKAKWYNPRGGKTKPRRRIHLLRLYTIHSIHFGY